MRQVFVHATDNAPQAGLTLGAHLVTLLRADGCLSPASEAFAGQDKIERLRAVYDALGYTLDSTGALRAKVVDNLTGTELTAALQSYVDRLNLNPEDAPLRVGTGKDLDEAVARHVLEQTTGSYPVSQTAETAPRPPAWLR